MGKVVVKIFLHVKRTDFNVNYMSFWDINSEDYYHIVDDHDNCVGWCLYDDDDIEDDGDHHHLHHPLPWWLTRV